MKKTRKIRFLAFILTLCLTLGALPLYVFADGMEAELPEQITETTNENLTAFQLGLGEKSVAELESMTLSAADIPASISRETIEAKDHVLRLREQEADLNTVIFQNRDGGKTVYLFGSPVKYVDANGNIRDKSTTLVSENVTVNGKTYAHSATDNFFGQYYPTMPQNGVMLAFGPYTVEMKPVITGVLTLRDTVVSDNKVTYNKVFGTGTSLVYTPTLNGVKEDIILSTYTGKSSFSFTIKTNGLAIIQDENDTFLADFEGNKVASLGDVIITDKVGKTVYGTMTVATKIEREEYTVTVNAPTAFLTNPTTVYPVTVDPTVTIQGEYTPDGYSFGDTIHDLCIYSANGSSPGYPESSIGAIFYNEDSCEVETARMLYRINPDYFEFDSIGNYFSDSRFSAAALNLKVNSHNESMEVSIYPYTADWCKTVDEYDVAYYSNGTISDYTGASAYNSYVAGICSTSTVDVSSYTTVTFDITDIVEYWRNNDCYDKGLLLGTSNDLYPEEEVTQPSYLDILQTETSSSNVCISIDYGTVVGENYINNKQTGHFLEYYGGGTNATTSTYNIYTRLKWKITYYGNNQYIIKSSVSDTLYLCSKDSLTAKTVNYSGTLTNEYLWTISYNYTYGGYIIKNVAYNRYLKATDSDTTALSSTLDSYCVWRMKEPSKYHVLVGCSVTYPEVFQGDDVIPELTVFPKNATWTKLSDFEFYTTSSVISISDNTVKGISGGSANIQIIHKPTGISASFTINVKRRAIIIVPGFMGSELKTTNAYNSIAQDEKLWLPINVDPITEESNLNVVERLNALKFDTYGVPLCSTVDTYYNNNNSNANEIYGTINAYMVINTKLYNMFKEKYDVIFFQYDWRKSNIVSANRLNEFINNKEYERVVFVAHSMGGLVVSNYLNLGTEQQNKVETLITLGTPFLGSVDVVEYFQYFKYVSDVLDIFECFGTNSSNRFARLAGELSEYVNTATDIIHNIPSVYELFPNKQYFELNNRFYMKNADPLDLVFENVTSYSETKNILQNKLCGYNAYLMNNAESVNNDLFTANGHITGSVNSFYIVGTNISTTQYIKVDTSIGYTFHSTEKNACGDGTVTSWSADLGGLYPSRTFYAANRAHNGEIDDETMNICSEGLLVSDNVIQKIKDIINGNPYSYVSGITQTRPVYE